MPSCVRCACMTSLEKFALPAYQIKIIFQPRPTSTDKPKVLKRDRSYNIDTLF